ncbi:uncharacterized protein DUF955 [Rathayibacter sp. PhB151]|nr:uncharacterized protein DUF955 [Rathayibacter sp. PhB151]
MTVLVKDAARDAATSTTQAFWGSGIPVNPHVIAEKLGIHVFESSLPDGVSGFIRKTADEDPVVFLEASHSPLRKRFTLAHEIGHYIERTQIQERPDEDFGFVEKRGANQDIHEYFANEFAANLLMPVDAVNRAFGSDADAIRLAAQFRVSVPAMRLRLDKLGLLS